jgi:hypothetical protein
MFGGYTFEGSSVKAIVRALLDWARLEISEGWRTWFEPKAAGKLSVGTSVEGSGKATYPLTQRV